MDGRWTQKCFNLFVPISIKFTGSLRWHWWVGWMSVDANMRPHKSSRRGDSGRVTMANSVDELFDSI